MENIEKKLYPSQVNSRTISARVPVQDYVSFLQEAMKDNISLNDWLLIKIYGNTKFSNGGGIGYTQDNVEYLELNHDDIFGENAITQLRTVQEYFEDEKFPFHITKANYFELINDALNALWALQNEREKKSKANLIDVKSQLTILMKNKFKTSKDLDSYRKELYELLDELK